MEDNVNPKFAGGFFGPKPGTLSPGTASSASEAPVNENKTSEVPQNTPQTATPSSIAQRLKNRRKEGRPQLKFCPICGKISTECRCGYQL